MSDLRRADFFLSLIYPRIVASMMMNRAMHDEIQSLQNELVGGFGGPNELKWANIT